MFYILCIVPPPVIYTYFLASYYIPEVQPEIWNVWLEVAGKLGSQRWFSAGSKSDFTQLLNICYKSPFAHSPPSVLRMNEQNGLTPVHLYPSCALFRYHPFTFVVIQRYIFDMFKIIHYCSI